MKKVQNNKDVFIEYTYNPRVIVQCIGNRCIQIRP